MQWRNKRMPYSLFRLWMIVTFILLTDTNTHAKCSTFSEDYEFDCQGHYSKLTYQDCQGNFFNTTGCYFLENFAQYRACASICNYLIVGSLDEEKCRLYCPGYLEENCDIKPTYTSSTAFTTATQNRTINQSITTASSTQTIAPTGAIIAITVIAVLTLSGVISMLLCRRHCVKYRLLNLECNDNEGDLSQLIVVRGVQESEDSLTTIIQSSSSLQLSTDVTTATADKPPNDSGTSNEVYLSDNANSKSSNVNFAGMTP